MPVYPEGLYELGARDKHITWLDPIISEVEASGAAAFLEAFFPVPIDRMLLLNNVCGFGNAGAAQNTTNLDINLVRPDAGGGFDRVVVKRRGSPADFVATPVVSIQWDGELLVPGGRLISVSVNFSAGAAVNFAVIQLCGVLIPMGNFQRV